jgi:tetratricopeptide (TPR) repeat protein
MSSILIEKEKLKIEELPVELFFCILSFLDAPSLNTCCFVCSSWLKSSNDSELWKNLYILEYLSPPLEKEIENCGRNWKMLFIKIKSKLLPFYKEIESNNHFVDKYFDCAIAHMELAHYQAAINLLTMAIKVKKEHPNCNSGNYDEDFLLLHRGGVYRQLGDKAKAFQDIEQAIKLDSRNSAYYHLRANWLKEDNNLEGALKDFTLAINCDPNIGAHYYNRALVYRDQMNYSRATQDLDKAIYLEPVNAEYWCSRGRVHSCNGNLTEALNDLDMAVSIDDRNSDYLHWRGRVHRDRGECLDAMRDFEKALSITCDDIDHAWRSIMQSQLKQNDKAIMDIETAISISPDNSFHHQYKGILLFGMEKYQEALETFTKAIELLPDWGGHYVWRAAVFWELGDVAKTTEDLDTAIKIKADEVPLFWRGILYLHLGNFHKAHYDLRSSLREAEQPIHARITFWLGVTKLLLGKNEESTELFQTTQRLSQSDNRAAKYGETARMALLLKDDFAEAKRLYKTFFEGYYTIDNAKTENTHLDLLSRLFPKNETISLALKWFTRKRCKLYNLTYTTKE